MLDQDQWQRLRTRFAELERAVSDPRLFADPRRAREVAREHARLRLLLDTAEEAARLEREIAEHAELLRDPGVEADAEFRELVAQELPRLEARRARAEQELRRLLVPPDPDDDRNSIVEIRAGTGGEEAALFASDLMRMYLRYAESRGWKAEILAMSPAERGGLKEVIFSLQGAEVHRRMRHEAGGHRVQRVPVTEASGRIHTSAATVAVLPEPEEVEIEIPVDDLRVDVYRSSGPGGQSVNTTDSAVRVTHLPTGLVVTCQDEKSQHKNKAKALRILRARLLERRQHEEHQRMSAERRTQIGSGDRSDRIRTYNFPQNRVSDHRIALTLHNLERILDGQLDALIEPLIEHDLEDRLRAGTGS